MKTYCIINDRISGINYYKKFEARLWKDLQIMPNDELRKMYENLSSRTILSPDSNVLEEKSSTISVFGFGVESIEWSLVSCIIDSIVKNTCDIIVEKLDPDVVTELSYNNKRLLVKFNRLTDHNITSPTDLSSIRIMQAFSNLLESISEYSKIEINIDSFENADKISKEVINYIEKVYKEINIIK
jgi:hypothetical protein